MTRHFRVSVAGQSLDVTGDAAARRFRPALSRSEVAGDGPADAVLVVEAVADPLGPAAHLTVGHNRLADGSFAALTATPPMLEGYRPGRAGPPRLDLVVSPAALSAGDVLAQPGHVAIAAWLAHRGSWLMHAAGVALDGRGVLLIGDGGRGKTTTALAAAQRGFSYLGDDLCIVSPDASGRGQHVMHGLYATAKLNPDTRDRLGITAWHQLGTTPKGKAVAALPTEIGFALSVPLAAIVLVGPPRHATTEVAQLSASEAIRHIGTAAGPAVKTSGPTGGWLAAMAALARDVPVLGLSLDWDLDRVVGSLADVAAGEPARRHGAP
jgi:hypothetical protein